MEKNREENETNTLLIESHCFPCLEYFTVLSQHKTVTIEAHEHYVKQTYRNRYALLGANQTQWLTIPVIHSGGKMIMKDVRIDYSTKWIQQHLRTIQTAYGKSPFYEFYMDIFDEILTRRDDYLLDKNVEILTKCLDLLQINVQLTYSEGYLDVGVCKETDLRNEINRKNTYDSRGFFSGRAYQQVFGKNFVPNLSVIDVLCCLGPEAGAYIRKSVLAVNDNK